MTENTESAEIFYTEPTIDLDPGDLDQEYAASVTEAFGSDQSVYDQGYEEGFDKGWDEGWEAAKEDENDSYTNGYHEGTEVGVKAEQRRIQAVLKTMFDASINLGQGNKAVQYRNMMELLRPIDVDYSEEAYLKDLENEGF